MHSYASASRAGRWKGFARLNILVGVDSFSATGSFPVLADLRVSKVCQKPRVFNAFTSLARLAKLGVCTRLARVRRLGVCTGLPMQ